MFDQIQNLIPDFTLVTLVILGTALFLSISLAYFYMFIHRDEGFTSDFPWTLVMIPPVVAMLILMIANNLAAGIAVGGLFALTRFRTNQRQTEDISFVLMAVVIGVISGTGYAVFAVMFTLIMMVVLFLLYWLRLGKTSDQNLVLTISIPENLNFKGVFDDILKKYCLTYNLNRVRTIDFGTLFEVTYYIVLKKSSDQKEFMDKIRERNGNLTVTLTVQRYNYEVF